MPRRLGRKIIAFVVVVSAIEIGVTQYYNSVLIDGSVSAKSNLVDQAAVEQKAWTAIQHKYLLSAVTQDLQYAAYVDSKNVVYIEDLSSGKTVSKVSSNSYPVNYFKWIGDSSLFVGEKDSNTGVIYLKTVDAITGKVHELAPFDGLDPTSEIKEIDFSVATNDIYILIGNSTSTVIYHYDANSDRNVVDVGFSPVKNIDVSMTTNTLYFEAFAYGSYNVYEYTTQHGTQTVELNAALITTVGDTLYYGSVNSNGLVNAVYKDIQGNHTLVKTLTKPVLASEVQVDSKGRVTVGQTTASDGSATTS